MRRFLLNRRVQKLFLPLALTCIVPIWVLLKQGAAGLSLPVYLLAGLGAALFLLDRIFKPWELERAERSWRAAEAREAAEKASAESSKPPSGQA